MSTFSCQLFSNLKYTCPLLGKSFKYEYFSSLLQPYILNIKIAAWISAFRSFLNSICIQIVMRIDPIWNRRIRGLKYDPRISPVFRPIFPFYTGLKNYFVTKYTNIYTFKFERHGVPCFHVRTRSLNPQQSKSMLPEQKYVWSPPAFPTVQNLAAQQFFWNLNLSALINFCLTVPTFFINITKKKHILMASSKSMGLSMKLKRGLTGTRGESKESITCSIHNEANKERGHQKSKTGVPVAPQKGLMSSKNFEKERKINRNLNK